MNKLCTSDIWKAQESIAKVTNYNNWIYELINPFIGCRVLDIGSGIGNVTKYFLDRDLIVSIDCSAAHVEYQRKLFSGCSNTEIFQYDVCNSDIIELLKTYNFDTAICLNVLEHIEQDDVAIRNIYELLPEGGRLVILVPAFQFLFGSLDEDHFRRYSRKRLSKLLERNGFKVIKLFYTNLLGMLVWYVNGKILRRSIDCVINEATVFNRWINLARAIEKMIKVPMGLSFVSVSEKARRGILHTYEK